jgi:hypothetical protein
LGVSCLDWLRCIMNRVDAGLFLTALSPGRRHHPNRTAILYLLADTSAAAFAAAARGHWALENKLHWVLDVTFREDLSRLRIGHGAENMALVRHFALNLVRQVDNRSIKRHRKRAAWDPQYLLEIVGAPATAVFNLDSLPWSPPEPTPRPPSSLVAMRTAWSENNAP